MAGKAVNSHYLSGGSVLYGQLAPGGIVNGVSKRPTDTALHEVNVEYGSNNRKQISGDFSGPVTDDGVMTYRLTGLLRNVAVMSS
jgi:iron complex outermembrane recepter protein